MSIEGILIFTWHLPRARILELPCSPWRVCAWHRPFHDALQATAALWFIGAWYAGTAASELPKSHRWLWMGSAQQLTHHALHVCLVRADKRNGTCRHWRRIPGRHAAGGGCMTIPLQQVYTPQQQCAGDTLPRECCGISRDVSQPSHKV